MPTELCCLLEGLAPGLADRAASSKQPQEVLAKHLLRLFCPAWCASGGTAFDARGPPTRGRAACAFVHRAPATEDRQGTHSMCSTRLYGVCTAEPHGSRGWMKLSNAPCMQAYRGGGGDIFNILLYLHSIQLHISISTISVCHRKTV